MALQHLLLFRWDLRATRAESIHRGNKHPYKRCKHSISLLRAKFWKKASPSLSSTLGEDLVLTALLKDTLKAFLHSVRKQTPGQQELFEKFQPSDMGFGRTETG